MPDTRPIEEEPRRRRRARAQAIAAGAVAIVAVPAVLLAFASDGQGTPPPVLPPPTTPGPGPHPDRQVRIPAGFLMSEADARGPVEDPDVRWVRSDAPGLPPLVSPCGGRLRSDAGWVGGRQLVLVHPSLWKSERLVVYRDVATARAALAERRAALRRCGRHRERGGTVTVWTSRPLRIGDEALFVGSQRHRGDRPVAGHGRGVLMRRGRAVVTYFDMGQARTPPTLDEVDNHVRDARVMARRIAAQPWARR